ncbi:CBO0543 family protein [Paenibacillus humicola]|uniref:CBO0543 family protein n=1 Tax=Paenibacillus humicola TaxID=3110540 RepID=UPI00237ADB4B|nr:CBO0543 family protein [Paenibacillus humicola]
MVLFWVSIFLLNIFAFLIPKTLPHWQIYATSLFAVAFQISVDIYFDLKWNLYGYFNKGVDNLGFVYQFGIYPAVSILFLTFWEHRRGFGSKLGYIFLWTVFSTGYEFMALKSGFFYYNGWKLMYSFFEYPVLFLILVANLRFLQWLQRKEARA